jgi:Protein of unknown function (DUF1569)
MKRLEELLNRIEAAIPNCETINQNISQASVGWHLEHILLVINGITNTLTKSNPSDYKWKLNFVKIIVFAKGKIPRGRGKSPSSVLPKENLNTISLNEHLTKIRAKIKELESLPIDKYFDHPYFGNLKKVETIKFLEIHTKHHLAIVEDILK